MQSMRLAKHPAHPGGASRRAAEALIADGRVAVDGEVATDPARDVTGEEAITLDGRPVAPPRRERVVFAVNKPAGVVSTARDTHGRPTVVDLVARRDESGARLYPVGRLDADTTGGPPVVALVAGRDGSGARLSPGGRLAADPTGLLLLTDDGDLAHRLTHPRYEVPKTYRARVQGGRVPERALRALREGVALDDGRTAPAHVRQIAPGELELTLREGRKRQVRRMCAAVGHPVQALQRVAF